MNMQETYRLWCDKATRDADLTNELERIKDAPAEIEDRFYRELEFGTGGLRGIMGIGTNRMNKYTVGMATQGYANYLKQCLHYRCLQKSP